MSTTSSSPDRDRVLLIRGLRMPALVAVAAFLVAMAVLRVALDEFARPSIHADGVGYYAPLASVLVDRDLALDNETAHLSRRFLRAAFMTPEGRLGNPFPVGPALLWAPGAYVVSLLPAKERLDAPLGERIRTAHPAFAPRYARSLLWTDQVLVVLAGAALCAILATQVGAWAAVIAVLAGILGTPVFFYVLHEPSYGHTASFFAVSAFVCAVLLAQRRPVPLELLGFLYGVAVLMRSQDALLGVLLLPRLVDAWRATTGRGSMARVLPILRTAWPALLAFVPQMLFWQRIYGQALLVPPGPDFLPLWKPRLLHLLFSTWNGALVWTPTMWLGFLGVLAIRNPHLRLAFAAALVLEIYSFAVIADWWGGRAFGPRRLVSIVPLLICGAAYALHALRNRRWVLACALVFLVASCLWTLRLAEYHRHRLLPPNPGNAADYVRHYVPGSPNALRYGHWDYPRLLRDVAKSEELLRSDGARRRSGPPR